MKFYPNIHPDTASLRRELVASGLMARQGEGGGVLADPGVTMWLGIRPPIGMFSESSGKS